MPPGVTIPQLFLAQAAARGDAPALGWIENGAVREWTFAEYRRRVEALSLGLRRAGLEAQEHVGLMSATRRDWHVVDLAVQCARGVVVPVYPTYLGDAASRILAHADCRGLVVDNEAQLLKVLPHVAGLGLRFIVCMDAVGDSARRSAEAVAGPHFVTLEELTAAGAAIMPEFTPEFERLAASQPPEDLASIVYTSGTTGEPKGAMIRQSALVAMLQNVESASAGVFRPDDTVLTFLPLSHVFGRQDSLLILVYGWRMVFAESVDRIVDNLALVRPTIMAAVPRIFERVYARILQQADESSGLRKRIFYWALGASTAYNDKTAAGDRAGRMAKAKRDLAWKLVFSKVYARFGGRMRWFISGGAALAPEIWRFLRDAGLSILEGYGLTETCAGCVINPAARPLPGTVGKPMGATEVRIADDGEILLRTGALFSGYYKNEADTREALDADGWLHTGDIGVFNEEGYLVITDRKKDLLKTSDGLYHSPARVENLLKLGRYVSQAVVIGENRHHLTALIGVEKDRFRLVLGVLGLREDATVAEIARAKHARTFVEKDVETANARLPRNETVQEFFLVPEEFTQENDLLTPSLKVKRKVLLERYAKEVEGMYAG